MRWLVPELLQEDEDVTSHSDTHFFSITILECLTLADPFANVKRRSQVVMYLVQGLVSDKPDLGAFNPLLEKRSQDDLWQLITHCWSSQPMDRPPMSTVSGELHSRVRNLDLLSSAELIRQIADAGGENRATERVLLSYRDDKARSALDILHGVWLTYSKA